MEQNARIRQAGTVGRIPVLAEFGAVIEGPDVMFWHQPIYAQAIEDLGEALMDGAEFNVICALTWRAVAFGMVQP